MAVMAYLTENRGHQVKLVSEPDARMEVVLGDLDGRVTLITSFRNCGHAVQLI